MKNQWLNQCFIIFNKYHFVLYEYQDTSSSDTDDKLYNFPE